LEKPLPKKKKSLKSWKSFREDKGGTYTPKYERGVRGVTAQGGEGGSQTCGVGGGVRKYYRI